MSEPRDVLIRHAGRRCVQGGAASTADADRAALHTTASGVREQQAVSPDTI